MVDVTVWAGGAHIGGALSMADVLTALYYHYLNVRPEEPDWPERDRFVLSKGHGGVGLAPVLADKGYFDKELLKEFNHFKSPFGMHLDGNKVQGVDACTGSLGHGLSMALGMALGARFQKQAWRTYCMLGDGECDEGSVWEAAMAAAHYKADNLTAFVDRNHLMIDGLTEDVMSLEPLADKWTRLRLGGRARSTATTSRRSARPSRAPRPRRGRPPSSSATPSRARASTSWRPRSSGTTAPSTRSSPRRPRRRSWRQARP